nr:MAG TPA: hypothetical protein [Caudoviricetes sp.]
MVIQLLYGQTGTFTHTCKQAAKQPEKAVKCKSPPACQKQASQQILIHRKKAAKKALREPQGISPFLRHRMKGELKKFIIEKNIYEIYQNKY